MAAALSKTASLTLEILINYNRYGYVVHTSKRVLDIKVAGLITYRDANNNITSGES